MDRQKILVIFGAAWLSAAVLTWFLYANTKAPKTEAVISVVAATRDMPVGTRLRKEDLKTVAVREKDVPKTAMLSMKDVLDRVLLYPISANEPITSSKVSSLIGADGIPATIQPGKRAVGVQFTDATGVAGLIQPHSHVDVMFTRPGTMTEAITTTLLQDIEVLSIGKNVQTGQTASIDLKGAKPASVVTLLVTAEQARVLELAKNQGKIGLSLRNPLDHSVLADGMPVTGDSLDPIVYQRLLRGRKGLPPGGKIPDLDDKTWRELIGEKPAPPPVEKKEAPKPPVKEPPKPPRATVDVFRGDKHQQEVFQ